MGGAPVLKIALTGPIGSGKSTVADLFRAQGARVVDADQIARRLLEPSEPGWRALRKEFGDYFFNAERTVDRQKLRENIFRDPAIRKKVDSLLHPLIRTAINENCLKAIGTDQDFSNQVDVPPLTVVEVPLLYEVGWQDDFDLVIVITADEELCLDRVMARDGVDRAAALAAFSAQMSPAGKVGMADYVIDNSGDIEATARQVKKLYDKLRRKSAL
ncbi:MAG: dephospho-CoA kinase [Desulfurivibrionaceae bacterium]